MYCSVATQYSLFDKSSFDFFIEWYDEGVCNRFYSLCVNKHCSSVYAVYRVIVPFFLCVDHYILDFEFTVIDIESFWFNSSNNSNLEVGMCLCMCSIKL